jgi:protoporphyrinogen oxidase
VELRRGRAKAVRYRVEEGEREIDCDAVISTLALPQLVRMLAGRSWSRELCRSSERLRFRALRLCNVLLDRPQVSPHTWLYVSEPRYLISRIQEPRHRSPKMAPAGQSSLMLELPCDVGDRVWSAPEEEIYSRCMEELEDLGFSGLRAATLDHFSSFVKEGYPIYHLDYRRDREQLLGYVGSVDNLISCGRQGAFRYVFMDTAMEMGLFAADSVLSQGGRNRRSIAELRSESGLVEAQAVGA